MEWTSPIFAVEHTVVANNACGRLGGRMFEVSEFDNVIVIVSAVIVGVTVYAVIIVVAYCVILWWGFQLGPDQLFG